MKSEMLGSGSWKDLEACGALWMLVGRPGGDGVGARELISNARVRILLPGRKSGLKSALCHLQLCID